MSSLSPPGTLRPIVIWKMYYPLFTASCLLDIALPVAPWDEGRLLSFRGLIKITGLLKRCFCPLAASFPRARHAAAHGETTV